MMPCWMKLCPHYCFLAVGTSAWLHCAVGGRQSGKSWHLSFHLSGQPGPSHDTSDPPLAGPSCFIKGSVYVCLYCTPWYLCAVSGWR